MAQREAIKAIGGKERCDSLVIVNVGGDISQIEVTIRAGVVIVAEAHAVAAVPEQPTPPAVDFGRAALARTFLSVPHSILVLDVLVAARVALVLFKRNNYHCMLLLKLLLKLITIYS